MGSRSRPVQSVMHRLASGWQHVTSRWLRPARGAVIGLFCAMVTWVLAQVPMMRGLEDWLLDGTFVLRGKRATAAQVLLIDIDDQSLDQLKKPLLFLSPELAETVGYLHDQGAAAIGLDVLIPESYSSLPASRPAPMAMPHRWGWRSSDPARLFCPSGGSRARRYGRSSSGN